jgi:hypothetical protein
LCFPIDALARGADGIDWHMYLYQYTAIDKTKRITANLPESLLQQAISITGKNLTETLIEGLQMVKRTAAFGKAQKLKGKLKLAIDLEASRERSRR